MAAEWEQTGGVLSPGPVGDYYNFGISCALSADGLIMAVGAIEWGATTERGGVFIYDLTEGAWVKRGSTLLAADGANGDYFGSAVALSDDGLVLAVGAYAWEGSAANQGGVYIFDWSGSAWVQRGLVLAAPAPVSSGAFGVSVALSGDAAVLVVGETAATGSYQGAVYTFDWSGSAWAQRGARILHPITIQEKFGQSVSLSGDGLVLVVGAQQADDPLYSTNSQGCVFTYDRSGDSWAQRGDRLWGADRAIGDYFGSGVALSGDASVLIVGAPHWEGSLSNQGGVYTFDLVAGEWTQRNAVLAASDAATNTAFGSAVAVSSDASVLAIGADGYDAIVFNQGVVYTYSGPSTAPAVVPMFWRNLFGQREE